jgi:hypothetical protein
MSVSICIKCGAKKYLPWQRCKHCKFDPSGDEDALVRSVYLSTGRFEEPDDQTSYIPELSRLAGIIQSGLPIEFDAAELSRLSSQQRNFVSVPWSAAWGAIFRFFLPALLLIAALCLLRFLLKR